MFPDGTTFFFWLSWKLNEKATLIVRSPFMVWAPSSYGSAVILWFRQKLCHWPQVTLGPRTPPHPPNWRSPKATWAIYSTHMGGGLDVTDLMSHLELGPPSPPTIQFGPMWKQETKGGGLRTAVASALLLVFTGDGLLGQQRKSFWFLSFWVGFSWRQRVCKLTVF